MFLGDCGTPRRLPTLRRGGGQYAGPLLDYLSSVCISSSGSCHFTGGSSEEAVGRDQPIPASAPNGTKTTGRPYLGSRKAWTETKRHIRPGDRRVPKRWLPAYLPLVL
ncbi:uncharacterized protein LOC143040520 [Oratosquilla oratoria]|uniref:uncharacterized protein LOC143026920 n=1 Tax=Oratosquilla oratoria TaxID=337810 RepID=UPI003F76649E